VVTPEGARIMRFDYILKDQVQVKEAQVVQRALGEVVLRVVRRTAYCRKDEDTIRQGFAQWISATMRLNFEYVDEIERERNGKFRAVVSHLRRTAP